MVNGCVICMHEVLRMEDFVLGAKLQHYYDHMMAMRKEVEWQIFDRHLDEDCIRKYQGLINVYDDLLKEYFDTFKEYIYPVIE